jgi:hypothetical protein
MTATSSTDPEKRAEAEGDDQAEYPFAYGHGRMPLFMKIAWMAFLVFATWYVVTYLLNALGDELS